MEAVWDESSIQAQDMLRELSKSTQNNSSGKSKSNATFEGLKTITINVIGFVCFGTQRSWGEAEVAEPPAGFQANFVMSILSIVNNFFAAIFIPSKLLQLPFMSKSAQESGVSKIGFHLHLHRSIAEERESPSSRSTLVTSLAKLADQDKSVAARSLRTSTYLTEPEITGNLFNFTIAGFDTTANTIAYSVMCLALYPEWQDCLLINIDQVSKSGMDEYSKSFPLLTRCLALMISQTIYIQTIYRSI